MKRVIGNSVMMNISKRKNENTTALRVVQTKDNDPELIRELVNSTIHGFGILFGITALPFLSSLAIKNPNGDYLPAIFMYGFSFLMVFTFSTIYHAFQHSTIKKVFEILDHISIYFLIAGTYTPLILTYMNNANGMVMLWLLWGLVLVGTIFKIYFGCRYNILSTVVYLLMGWMILWTGGEFFRTMPPGVIKLVLGGGFLYTAGVIFFLWEKLKWHHAVWHFLALAGAVCHFLAIYKSMLL